MSTTHSKADVVIVNWNSGSQLREAISSLGAHPENLSAIAGVVVVDNGSSDGSAEGLEEVASPAVQVIRNGRNAGFAAACNQGAVLGRAPYVLLLNPDTRMEAGALSGALAFMDSEAGASFGICGVQMVGEDGKISRSCARFPTPKRIWMQILGLDRLAPKTFSGVHMKDWDHATSAAVDHVIGAFFLVRRGLYERLQGLDERFFVYLEDLDFSFRAARLGFRTWYHADLRIFHRGGGSSHNVKALRLLYSLRSRLLYAQKHFEIMAACSVIAGTLAIEPWARLALLLSKGKFVECGELFRGYCLLLKDLPNWWRLGRGES